MAVLLNCETCSKPFQARSNRVSNAKYCSRTCASKGRRGKTILSFTCVICGKTFTRWKGKEAPNTKCCSKRCTGLRARQVSPTKSGPDHYLWKGGKQKDKVKINARARVRNAILSGKLCRGSCEVCGSSKTEAHHDDYSKPLEVRWFCPRHHRLFHLNNGHPWREVNVLTGR